MPFRDPHTLQVVDITDLTASAAELNILDGALLDVDELNILNGLLASTSELNLLNLAGMTAGEVLLASGAAAASWAAQEHAKAALTGSFTGFTSAQAKTLNITSVPSNNPVIRKIELYISNDPGADQNINCRLSLYNADGMTEDELIFEMYLNLTYTETNGGASASDTTDGVDSIGGLVLYDLIRYTGGTAEQTRLTATPTGTTLTFVALTQDHSDNTGIVRVAEIVGLIQLVDNDASNEIHAKLEFLDAPNASTNVAITVDIQ